MCVASRGNPTNMGEFVERHGLHTIDNVADVDSDVWDRNGVGVQPAWVFIDGESGDATTRFGELGADELRAELEALEG